MRFFMSCAVVFIGVGSSLCVAGDAVLFSDDFASWRPGWGEADDGINVGGNKLLVKPPANKLRRALYLGRRFDDADIRIRVVQNSGAIDQLAGLAFWGVDNLNYYALLVQSDGSTFVGRYQNGKLLNIRFSRGNEVRKGIGASNDLRVVTSSDSAVVYVNDKEITRFHGFPPANGNLIGVHAESGAVVAAWAFSELSARKGAPHAYAQQPRDADLLYAADFSTFDPSWGKKNEITNVRDGKLELNVPPKSIIFPMFEGRFFHDVDLRVKVTPKQGALNSGGGIIFWARDASNYYAAQVQPDGGFLIDRRMNGKVISPVRVEARDEVRQGIGGENELRVVTSGRLAVISINGREATRFKGFPPEGGSKIGVYGDSGDTPSVWAFSDLTVRQGPPPPASAQKADDADLLYAADFSTLDPSWGGKDETNNVRDGKLELNLPKAYSINKTLFQGSLFDDVDLRAKVTSKKGALACGGGVIFWAKDAINYYAAQVQPDGAFLVAREMNGKWFSPVRVEARDEVRQGIGGENELRVVTSGRLAVISINGREATRFKGFPPEGGSKIGVYGDSGDTPGVWALSDLTVRQGPPPPASAKPADDAVIFAEDFSAFDPSWGPPRKFVRVAGGKLLITPEAKSLDRIMYQGTLFGDADMRVKVTQVAGALDNEAGLQFWTIDDNNYCLIYLRSDGSFALIRYEKGEFTTVYKRTAPKGVKKGLGQVNELRVVTKGNHALMFVNGVEIGEYTSKSVFPPPGGGAVGLFTSSKEEGCLWAFTELKILKPK